MQIRGTLLKDITWSLSIPAKAPPVRYWHGRCSTWTRVLDVIDNIAEPYFSYSRIKILQKCTADNCTVTINSRLTRWVIVLYITGTGMRDVSHVQVYLLSRSVRERWSGVGAIHSAELHIYNTSGSHVNTLNVGQYDRENVIEAAWTPRGNILCITASNVMVLSMTELLLTTSNATSGYFQWDRILV